MQAIFNRAPVVSVTIEHQGETVEFDFKYYERSTGAVFGTIENVLIPDPFNEINNYWKRLPEEQQAHIFLLYRQIRDAMDTIFNLRSLQERMTDLTTQLANMHSYEALDHFTRFYSPIIVPNDIGEFFDPNNIEIIGTREKTYIKEDYRQLILLSIALRPIGVYWGEYINRVESEVDTTWKELTAYYLILKSWIPESEPLQRLEIYVKANVDDQLHTKGIAGFAPAIIAGIGIEDYPQWLLALILLKRVVFADIRVSNDGRSIIQPIFGYIKSKLDNPGVSFKGDIRDKDLETDLANTDEGKLSLFESYKSKIDLPLGEIAYIEHILDNPLKVARQAQPEVDDSLVVEILDTSKVLLDQRINEAQINLMQWTLSNVLPVRIVPHLEKNYVVKALAITSAVLYQRGYQQLAALVTAYQSPRGSGDIRVHNEQVRIPKELSDKMDEYFPYARRVSNKVPKQKPNPGQIAIQNMYRRFETNTWTLTLPEHLLATLPNVKPNNQYNAPADFRLILTEFVIDLNERTKHELPDTVSFTDSTI